MVGESGWGQGDMSLLVGVAAVVGGGGVSKPGGLGTRGLGTPGLGTLGQMPPLPHAFPECLGHHWVSPLGHHWVSPQLSRGGC